MSMSITHLGTGSRGNSTLIECGEQRVLIDQGFSGRQLEKRLGRIDLKVDDITAVLITHHHGDHGGGAGIVQRKWNLPIYCNTRTADELGLKNVNLFESLEALEFGSELAILPVPVPHDGADNVAFIASHRGERAAVVTDLGSWTEELSTHLRGCQHISLEANYDTARLWNGPYPYSLKERISGRGGHLSNDQSGEFLAEIVTDATRSIVLTHLSDKNNKPHMAESTVLHHIGEVFTGDIAISAQDGPDFSHHIGQSQLEYLPQRGLTL